MEIGRASKTALRVAQRRAIHQLLDHPPVLVDPIAVPLLGSQLELDPEIEQHPFSRSMRAFMAVRSRYAEDRLAESVSAGITQYVILGAGLDTFAYRNPFPQLRVFEVDFPATQEWKRAMLAESRIPEPENLTFAPLDFEHKALAEGLADAGFDASRPAFFAWLGVVPYLTLGAFRSTLETIASLPPGTGLSFDYALSPENFAPKLRLAFEELAKRVARAGEPFQLFFAPDELSTELHRAGFARSEQLGPDEINNLYFAQRTDGLKLPSPGLGRFATAWI
jgi:methyltransferase (TIGR00027 family)